MWYYAEIKLQWFPRCDGLVDPETQHTLVDHAGKYWAGVWWVEPGSGQPAGETRLSNAE